MVIVAHGLIRLKLPTTDPIQVTRMKTKSNLTLLSGQQTTGSRIAISLVSLSILAFSLTTYPSSAKTSATQKQGDKTTPADAAVNTVTEAKLQSALATLEKMSQQLVTDQSVPGLAVGVVYKDKLVYARGFGVREVGKSEPVDADTVFQLASVSKPIASTVVAALVGEGKINWDSKISELDPQFKMFDPWVTSQITIRDFFAHRSGLPDHAGDLLEDLGGDRAQVLHSLRYQKPDSSFRSHYEYTNFGITEGAVAAAKAYGLTWEEASEQKLFRPLGMNSSSARYNDFMARPNKALGHVKENNQWVHRDQRQPDAQSPAGGVSSSVTDMAKWMRLQIDSGKFEGKQIVNENALAETHHPTMLTQFNPFNGTPGFYGLGFNVSYDEHGRLRLNHSGAFGMGAATCVTIMPGEQLGVIALTNGSPSGIPEAINATFVDIAQNGAPQHDWLAIFKKAFQNPALLGEVKGVDYSKAPISVAPQSASSVYVGKYRNDFFGDLEIKETNGKLSMIVGPKNISSPLTHYNRDIFTYMPIGENADGLSGVTFLVGPGEHASEIFVEHLNKCGEGTFKLVK
ncbi:MAG: serine hydrolase [Candidatus Melainabacteria bacterium]|nr:MAG: serine hydrolase [Candidatus Melainabacteria bacterium]